MKLEETRKFIKRAVKQNREIQIGEPFTDYDIRQCLKEIDKIERQNSIMRWHIGVCISVSILAMILELIMK
jgi:hypothetical protein